MLDGRCSYCAMGARKNFIREGHHEIKYQDCIKKITHHIIYEGVQSVHDANELFLFFRQF